MQRNQEIFVNYPDFESFKHGRRHGYPGDRRSGLMPFLAHAKLGDTFK